MNVRPKPGEIYRHFKGNLYQIIAIAKHSETGEELVIYQALYGTYGVYARPLSMFVSEVDHVKYPEAAQKFRFQQMEQSEGAHIDKSEAVCENVIEAPQAAEDISVKEKIDSEIETESEEEQAAPELLKFLDADTYNEKYKVLKGMENSITDRLINDFAVILDVVIPEGELSHRYEQLKQCVATMARYETTRLR